jgi:hypothetical protein
MFKTLYRCARIAGRHQNGPAGRSRLAYLEHLAAGGATRIKLPRRDRERFRRGPEKSHAGQDNETVGELRRG